MYRLFVWLRLEPLRPAAAIRPNRRAGPTRSSGHLQVRLLSSSPCRRGRHRACRAGRAGAAGLETEGAAVNLVAAPGIGLPGSAVASTGGTTAIAVAAKGSSGTPASHMRRPADWRGLRKISQGLAPFGFVVGARLLVQANSREAAGRKLTQLFGRRRLLARDVSSTTVDRIGKSAGRHDIDSARSALLPRGRDAQWGQA